MFGWLRRRRDPATATEHAPRTRFRMLAGRRRLAEAPYLLPSDFLESNRLDMQHFMLKLAFGEIALAPVRQPRGILDVGCGTGRWAREMALRFPEANVVGIDLVEPAADVAARQQADLGKLPENYVFVQGNVLAGLPFAAASFDYTHLRFLGLAIPMAQWPGLVAEMQRVTQPGGWLEIVEFDIPEGGGPAFEQIQVYWKQLAAKYGLHPGAGSAVRGYMEAAGLASVQERVVRVQTSDRATRTGRLAAVDLYTGLAGSGPAMVNAGIVSQAEFDRLYAQIKTDLEHHNTLWVLHAVTGQCV